MSVSLLDNSKYKSWAADYNFENCKLGRKEYGEFLVSYITQETDGFVLNLNGGWGSGKTNLLKRMYVDLLGKRHPAIYVDAWESDFVKEPLVVIASELINQLQAMSSGIGEDLNKLSDALGRFLKASFVGVSGVITKKFIDDSTVGVGFAENILNETSKGAMRSIRQGYAEQVEAIKEVRENLEALSEVLSGPTFGNNLPVVVLVDELDRCRPTYAIEMLETIKHFFCTRNFVFVVATDTEQLEHSIKAVYGNDFASGQYLRRFFDRRIEIPEPDIDIYLSDFELKIPEGDGFIIFPCSGGDCSYLMDNWKRLFSCCMKAYGFKVRDSDQILVRLKSILSYISVIKDDGKVLFISLPLVLLALCEQHAGMDEYWKRNSSISDSVKKYLSVNDPAYIQGTSIGSVMDDNLKICDFEPNKMACNNSTFEGKEGTVKNKPDLIRYYNVMGSSFSLYNRQRHDGKESILWSWSDYQRAVDLAGNIT